MVGLLDGSGRQLFANNRTANPATIAAHGPGLNDFKGRRCRLFVQKSQVPFPVAAAAEILADDQHFHLQGVEQDIVDESSGRAVDYAGKINEEKVIGRLAAQEFLALLVGAYQMDGMLKIQAGMGVKSEDYRQQSFTAGGSDQGFHDFFMPGMKTIKIADSYRSGAAGFFQAGPVFHLCQ
jgi:hypothetical protein